MSSYLLLRNNTETGPFTVEELKAKSLKPYDLIWIEGKSAAWRYPAEISDLRSFAPALPEQKTDLIRPIVSESPVTKSNPSVRGKTTTGCSRSVYVNLPAEKRMTSGQPQQVINDSGLLSEEEPRVLLNQSVQLPASSGAGKLLWALTIILLFGAGILTGFFISDRRHSSTLEDTHTTANRKPGKTLAIPVGELYPAVRQTVSGINAGTAPGFITDSIVSVKKPTRSASANSIKKSIKNNVLKTDSVRRAEPPAPAPVPNDTVSQNALRMEMLYQKLRLHPENLVDLQPGKYSTGVFGGISSFPVTVTNNSPVRLDLVSVAIDYFQSNGKLFKTEILSFNDLQPGEEVTIKAPKSPRGTKITSRLVKIDSQQLRVNWWH